MDVSSERVITLKMTLEEAKQVHAALALYVETRQAAGTHPDRFAEFSKIADALKVVVYEPPFRRW
jgi:hypothetical protein